MNNYLQNLIADGEHLKQDFKFEISDVRKIAKTLVAFSNTEGGKLNEKLNTDGALRHRKDTAEKTQFKPRIKTAP